MKKQVINIISAALIIGLIISSCSKNYLNINNNPNQATSTTPELVLPQALTTTAAEQCAVGSVNPFIQCWMGYWAISGSYAPSSTDPASYYQTTSFGDGTWQALYHNLEDYNYIEQAGKTENKPFYEGTAKIMKALIFQRLVDMFNNVPYSQAFNGPNLIDPKYDSAQSVYTAITSQLDSGVLLMENPLAVVDANNSDVLFKGNNTSWIQFANTLELRILMRQSQVEGRQSYINTELANIEANGQGFLTADAGVNPGYANNPGQQSPFWGFFVTQTGLRTTGGTSDYYRTQQYLVNYFLNNNDTFRMRRDLSPSGLDLTAGNSQADDEAIFSINDYVGNVLGAGFNGLGGSGASSVGEGLLQSVTQNAILISASESYFLQAEAASRGWTGFSDAATAFDAGVLASFVYLESNNPNINKNPAVEAADLYNQEGNTLTNYTACTSAAQQLQCIIEQKWVAMNGINPFEAWCDYRRTGYPNDIPASISQYVDNPPTIPIRILYPISEYSTNTANVDAQGTINGHTSPVFWNQ
jgi:hypothetical protein